MSDHQPSGSPATETNLLVASNRIDGTKVTGRDGDSIGSVHSLMIDKRTGRSMYAVLSLGGFLGLGKSYYPLPFELLSFDPLTDSYSVTIDRRLLEGGPSWANNPPEFDQAYADRVSSYYGSPKIDLSLT